MGNRSPRPVFLLTDFGTVDPYVGLMKSVLLEEPPFPPVVDLTHDVPPQNEMNATFLLHYVLSDLPRESVLLLVVDPEVGTDRRIIAVETRENKFVVAPDTGMVDELNWKRSRYVTNEDLSRGTVSSTFHGRDWFAPVGRYLSLRGDFEHLGEPANNSGNDDPVPDPEVSPEQIKGTIVHVDRFGNLISNIPRETFETVASPGTDDKDYIISIAGTRITNYVKTYQKGSGLVALVGSFGTLEVALPNGSAADDLQAEIGTPLLIRSEETAQEA